MRRLAAVTLTLSLLALVAAPVAASEEPLDLIGPIVDFFTTPEGQEFGAKFTKPPVEGKSTVTDPVGDFGHSTGESPGYTPDHIDIVETWVVDLDPGPINLLGPTTESDFWAPTGSFHVEPPTLESFHTFTGDEPRDGSQYDDGAYLFGFTVAAPPPVTVAGRCEFVAWIHDQSRAPVFENHPAFPFDPAGGTNVAFGLGINPENQGLSSTFALELQKTGGFSPNFETDIRSVIVDDYIGITVPKSAIGNLAAVNLYTFCVREGFSFDPADSGSDQTGLIEVTDDDLGILVIEALPVAVETTTTTLATTTTTTLEGSEPTEKLAFGDESEFPWWLVLVGGGIVLAVLGFWLFKEKGDPCKELLEAWKAAQKACDEAQTAADEAADDCEEAELELEDLQEERKELCKAWPPACWSTEDGGWIEDDRGNRITSRDVHMRKMALGEIWSDYKAGKLTAGEVEAKWKEMDTPEFREEMRETDEAFKELLEDIDADIEEAEEAADEACEAAAEAQGKADEACAAAEAARKAYEECVGAAVAGAGAEGGTEGGTEGGPSAPAATSGPGEEPSDPCEGVEPKRKYEPAGKADRIRVNVDFSIIVGRSEGSERRVEAGQQLVIELDDLAQSLDMVGDLLNARRAGLHIGSAYRGYTQGKYVAMSTGIVRGGIEAAAATDKVPDIPTSPLQAGTELLEKITQLGSFVAGKVTEWMSNYQIFTVRRTFFYQNFKATPYTIWECRKGVGWVCLEKVWEIEIGKLRRLKGKDRWFTVNSSVRRAQFQREIRRLSQSAANTIKRDAQRLIQWRAQHEAGPCP